MEDPLQYWGKIFPVYKGYSSNLFGGSSAEGEEEGADGEGEGEGEAQPAEQEEVSPEETQEEENLPPARVFGSENPMIFGDLEPVGGFAHIPLQFKPARWYRGGYSSLRKF